MERPLPWTGLGIRDVQILNITKVTVMYITSGNQIPHISTPVAPLTRLNSCIRSLWTEIFHDNLTLPKSTEKCWLELDLNSHLRDTNPPLYLLSYRVHRDWRRVFIQIKCTRYSRDNLTLIHERMCSISILFQHMYIMYTVYLWGWFWNYISIL